MLDDGTVRYTFTQPKEALLLLRGLAAGHASAFDQLCDLFDQQTDNGADMSHHSQLIRAALRSIESTFQRRAATALLSSRSGLLPLAEEVPQASSQDLELVTWLVVMPSA